MRLKKKEIVHSDKATESRYISSTRWALEDGIEILEQKRERLVKVIDELTSLGEKKKETGERVVVGSVVKVEVEGKIWEFLVTETTDDFENGIWSVRTALVKGCLGRKKGDSFFYVAGEGKKKVKILDVG